MSAFTDFNPANFPFTDAQPNSINVLGFQVVDAPSNDVKSTDFSQGGFGHANSADVLQTKLPPPTRPKKRIVLCCDGSWQSSAHGNHTIPSNVAKMSRSVANWYVDENGLAAPQIVYYDAGVGTEPGKLEGLLSGYFGVGLDNNVCEAYNFLVNNYVPGDELFFFGFSRGAYTARACAGLVCRVGICKPSAMGQFWEMYANYRALPSSSRMEESAWGKPWTSDEQAGKFTITVNGQAQEFVHGSGYQWLAQAEKNVKIKVVGVWDTVGALGYPENVWKDVSKANAPYGFHNTEIHPQIENAFQALGLDEHRKPYSPALWVLPENSATNLIQCWFPGVHVNIGGGSTDGLKKESKGDLEMMSITTFMWMVDRCYPFLRFQMDLSIVSDYRKALNKVMEKAHLGYGGWGIGPIVDSYNGIMVAAGSQTRTPGHYFLEKDPKEPKYRQKRTNEYFHPVIQHAVDRVRYNPEALQGFDHRLIGPGKGYKWVKTYKPAAPTLLQRGLSLIWGPPEQEYELTVEIPEFIIPLGGFNDDGDFWLPMERYLIQFAAEDGNQGFLPPDQGEVGGNLQVNKEGQRFLLKLDEANKDTEEFNVWKAPKFTNSNPKYDFNLEVSAR